jgi:hypothetical protein
MVYKFGVVLIKQKNVVFNKGVRIFSSGRNILASCGRIIVKRVGTTWPTRVNWPNFRPHNSKGGRFKKFVPLCHWESAVEFFRGIFKKRGWKGEDV